MYCLHVLYGNGFSQIPPPPLGMNLVLRLICLSDKLFIFYHICLVLSKIADVDVNSIKSVYRHDITEIVLEMALNTETPLLYIE